MVNFQPRYLVDTNIIVRFFVGKLDAQTEAANHLFTRAELGEVHLEIWPVVVAESYYTLLSHYQVDRPFLAEKLSSILQISGVILPESSVILTALKILETTNVSFVDAYLAAGAIEEKIPLTSFDRGFDKFKNLKRIAPDLPRSKNLNQ